MKDKRYLVILVGFGPSCISAAIQLKRAGIDPLIITKNIGGLVKNANLIENLLGFPNGISGDDLYNKINKQVENYNLNIIFQEVIKIEIDNNYFNERGEYYFKIYTLQDLYYSDFVIVGSGTIPKKLGIEGEMEAFKLKKLFYEVIDVLEIRNIYEKEIFVIGSGDIAYDYSP